MVLKMFQAAIRDLHMRAVRWLLMQVGGGASFGRGHVAGPLLLGRARLSLVIVVSVASPDTSVAQGLSTVVLRLGPGPLRLLFVRWNPASDT
jgi:hypothetical protein